MIVRDKPSAWRLLFLMKGSIVPTILPQVIFIALFSVGVKYVYYAGYLDLSRLTMAPFAVFGVALSLFLGFRNNAAYERWWEARRHWGQLVYDVRSLARVTGTLLGEEHPQRRGLLKDVLAFSHFLRGSLRHKDARQDAERFIGAEASMAAGATKNPADYMLRQMGQRLGQLYRDKEVDSIGLQMLDERLTALSALQAANERIATTPLPFAYSLLVHRTAYLYCFLIPFSLASSVGWFSPFVAALVAYVFFGLDALSQELENPFGNEENDLPLDALCRINEVSVAEALNEDVPDLLEPVNYKLN